MDARSEAQRLYQEEHLSPSEIAAKLEVSPGTIRSWKKRDKWPENNATLKRNATQKTRHASDTNKQIVNEIEIAEGLTELEKDFCMYYIGNYNATQAAIKAGYSGSYAAIKNLAWTMLRKPQVLALIKTLKEMKRLSIMADIDDMIELQMRIAFSDIGNYVEFGHRDVPVMSMFGPLVIKDEETGEKVHVMKTINFVDFKCSEITDTQLIAKVSQGKDGAKIELASRDKALDFLAQYFLANPMDKHKIEYDNKRLKIEERKQNSDPDFEAAKLQVMAIADLINKPAAERNLEEFMGEEVLPDDTLCASDEEAD